MPQPTTLVYGFRNGKEKATLTVSDLGTENSAPGPAHWTGPPNRREPRRAPSSSTARAGPRCARSSGARRRRARWWCCWRNGIMVSAAGDADMKTLKALADGVPVNAAEALVRPTN